MCVCFPFCFPCIRHDFSRLTIPIAFLLHRYHDQMYAQQGHAPVANAVQESEIRHQVRRLSHHPSIVMWDGCNARRSSAEHLICNESAAFPHPQLHGLDSSLSR